MFRIGFKYVKFYKDISDKFDSVVCRDNEFVEKAFISYFG